jgi:plasmid stabilization system protein ParE
MQSRLTLPQIPLFTLGSVVRRIIELTRTLEKFPRAGRKVPEFDDESLRELIAYSYRIIYRVETAEVIVAAVIHGKRDLGSVSSCTSAPCDP